jgi:hypothetical protein
MNRTSPTTQISKKIIFFLLGLAAAGLVLFPLLLLGQQQKNADQPALDTYNKGDYDKAIAISSATATESEAEIRAEII